MAKPRFLSYYYYAYGSNLSLSRMRYRCPDAEPLGPFGIRGWRLEFCGATGVANAVEGEKEDWLEGALYKVTAACERWLDKCEGYYPSAPAISTYRKIDFRIPATGEEAFMYLYNHPKPGTPSHHYLSIIKRGYKDWGFNTEPLMAIARAHGYTRPHPTIEVIGERQPPAKSWPKGWPKPKDDDGYGSLATAQYTRFDTAGDARMHEAIPEAALADDLPEAFRPDPAVSKRAAAKATDAAIADAKQAERIDKIIYDYNVSRITEEVSQPPEKRQLSILTRLANETVADWVARIVRFNCPGRRMLPVRRPPAISVPDIPTPALPPKRRNARKLSAAADEPQAKDFKPANGNHAAANGIDKLKQHDNGVGGGNRFPP